MPDRLSIEIDTDNDVIKFRLNRPKRSMHMFRLEPYFRDVEGEFRARKINLARVRQYEPSIRQAYPS